MHDSPVPIPPAEEHGEAGFGLRQRIGAGAGALLFAALWLATAMMLLPIGVSVHALLGAAADAKAGGRELGAALVLAIAYGANLTFSVLIPLLMWTLGRWVFRL